MRKLQMPKAPTKPRRKRGRSHLVAPLLGPILQPDGSWWLPEQFITVDLLPRVAVVGVRYKPTAEAAAAAQTSKPPPEVAEAITRGILAKMPVGSVRLSTDIPAAAGRQSAAARGGPKQRRQMEIQSILRVAKPRYNGHLGNEDTWEYIAQELRNRYDQHIEQYRGWKPVAPSTIKHDLEDIARQRPEAPAPRVRRTK
jgi:hypothetical protein